MRAISWQVFASGWPCRTRLKRRNKSQFVLNVVVVQAKERTHKTLRGVLGVKFKTHGCGLWVPEENGDLSVLKATEKRQSVGYRVNVAFLNTGLRSFYEGQSYVLRSAFVEQRPRRLNE